MALTGTREPYYLSVAHWLREQILSGVFAVGEQLPTEDALAKKFGVSRMTARHAVTEIVQEGMVYRVQGKGTFVARDKLERHLNSLTGFFEEMETLGLKPESRILNFEKRLPDDREQRLLDIRKSEEIYAVRRIRYLGGVPIGVQHFTVPVRIAPGLEEIDLESTSFYRYLRGVGVEITSAKQTIEASLNPEVAAALDVAPERPFLCIERVSLLDDGSPVELLVSWFRGDKYSYSLQISR